MRKILLLLAGCLAMGFLQAQTRVVTGTVTDDTRSPIPNASVLIKGTSTGTTTGNDGTFSINLPSSARMLVISAIGMKMMEVNIVGKSTIEVSMQQNDRNLQEVVVVGYGTQSKKDVTGSVSQVAGGKIKDVPVQSFEQALSGRAAGVNISIPNGVMGNPPVIRIRGINSISLSSFPLVVIDGMPTFTGDVGGTAANNLLAGINPSDIESIEILKDASAAAIYGSRAAAGVLLITTKKGKQGKAKVNYEGWAGFTEAYNLIDVLNAEEYTALKNEGLTNAGTPANGTTRGFYTMNDASGKLVDTRWYDHIYRRGYSQNHNLSVSGATDKTQYYFSVGYTDQEGMIKNNDFKRLSGRFTLDQKVNTWLSVGGTFNYNNGLNTGINTGSLAGTNFNTSGAGRLPIALAPNVSPYNDDGTYNINVSANQIGQGKNISALAFTNPVLLLNKNKFTSEGGRIISNAYAQVKFPFGLSYKTVYGIDYAQVENKEFRTGEHGDGVQFGGAAQNSSQRFRRWNWQHIVQYDKRMGENHHIDLLVGGEQQGTRVESWGADRRTVADAFFDEYQGTYASIVPVLNGIGENYLMSFFARANYDYKSKYYLSLNGRRDGYSALAPGKKWGNFGGGSAGWVISEEKFWSDSRLADVVNSFKLRGSYGQVGNNLGIGDFASFTLFSSGLYGDQLTFFFSQAGNSALSWETSKKTDLGFTAGFFNDRLTIEAAYYKNNIDGLILNDPQAPSRGIPGNAILRNIGSMYNKGFEFTVNANMFSGGNLSWTTNFNITTQTNKVTALATGNADILVSTGGLESASIIRVGESVGSFYVVRTAGVNPENGRRIFLYRDGTKVQYDHAAAGSQRWRLMDGSIAPRGADQASDGVVMGPAIPKWFGGWDNNFRYKGFDLNVLIYFSGGNYVYNGTKAGLRDNRNWNSSKETLNRWQKAGDVTNIPRIVFGDNISNGSGIVIAENVEKGDFLKFRNISFGYTIPAAVTDRLKISSIRVYVAALNAITITGYSGFDPEISSNGNSNGSPGIDRNSVPMARTINAGINVGF